MKYEKGVIPGNKSGIITDPREISQAVQKRKELRAKYQNSLEGWTTDVYCDRPECEFCGNDMVEARDSTGNIKNELTLNANGTAKFKVSFNCRNGLCKAKDKENPIETHFFVRKNPVTKRIEFRKAGNKSQKSFYIRGLNGERLSY